jgi:hypothetical protein
MSTTVSKISIHPLLVFHVTLQSVSVSLLETVCSVLCFSSSKLSGLFKYTLSLRNPHRKNSDRVRSGDHSGQGLHSTMYSPKNLQQSSCHDDASVSLTLQPANTVWRWTYFLSPTFLCPEILLSVGVLLYYLVFPWCSELSSGLYCRVKWLSTNVSEVRTASIIRDE